MSTDPRESCGRLVRETWVTWAREQRDPKPSWLTGWDELDDGQREVDMRIGQELYDAGRHIRLSEREQLKAEGAAAERDRIYAPDNFPGDGSVGPDEIPPEYAHLNAAYWHRRWLWTMNRLDEAPTALDVRFAADGARDAERQAIKQRLLDAAAEMGYDPSELWGVALPHLADFLHDLLDGDGNA